MEPLVDTVIEDARWETAGLPDVAERAAVATLVALGLEQAGFQICVMGCDDARIAALNADFRGKTTATNVLSWPAEDLSPESPGAMPHTPEAGDPDDPVSLGDIAISFETCLAEAQAQAKSLQDHATHLIVHASLHLLGYDHGNDADAALMEATEVRILHGLGLADPYA